MAQFKNSQFMSDDHYEHTLHVGMCVADMDTYSGDIDFRANLHDKMAEHLVNWKDIRSGLADEWGEQRGTQRFDEEKELHRPSFSRFSILFSCATRIHDLN